jgi:hypothetical protein
MALRMCFPLLVLLQPALSVEQPFIDKNAPGIVQVKPGTYHGSYCSITNAIFVADEKKYVYRNSMEEHLNCKGTLNRLWKIENRYSIQDVPCHKTYDTGHTYSVFYFYGSNYYHLHTDTLMPLFAGTEWPKSSQWAERIWEKGSPLRLDYGKQIFMPIASVKNQVMSHSTSIRYCLSHEMSETLLNAISMYRNGDEQKYYKYNCEKAVKIFTLTIAFFCSFLRLSGIQQHLIMKTLIGCRLQK